MGWFEVKHKECLMFILVPRYGLVPLPDQVEKVDKTVAATQPKISFRKRKHQSLRERDDSD